MPSFDIIRTAHPSETFRVRSVMGTYDMDVASVTERFTGEIDLPDNWNVGLIVGRSGSGKTTIARELFGDCIINGFDYTHESILDDMPQGVSVEEICKTFCAVGFSSPPSWLKSYSVLSNGEKMRCDLARAILEHREVFVFDEFTSVVDRTVAQIGSFAVQKAIRRGGQKFIAVSCHYDIQEWLQPDWVFNTDTMTFSTIDAETQKKNRPAIDIEIYETKHKREFWSLFRKYHYLSDSFNVAAKCYVAYANGQLAALTSILPQPHPVRKRLWRMHRTVVFPDFQGVGIASAIRSVVADSMLKQGYSVSTVTSNRAMIASMRKSQAWKCVSIGRKQTRSGAISLPNQSGKRITATFEYVGVIPAPKRKDDKSIN